MSLISQMLSVSYPAVLANARKPENQWAESPFMRELERLGGIDRVDFGPTIEIPLDWRMNPGAGFQTNELDEYSLTLTDVITTASYAVAELQAPIVWSKKQEATNPSQNQKVALVKSLLTNAMTTHDELIEQALFAASATSGFLSLPVIAPTDGLGTVGGIDASAEAFWTNPWEAGHAASTIEPALTTLWNEISKGSGSKNAPKMIISGSATHATFEGVQQALQRYVDVKEADAGYKILAFKTARYSFSQYGGVNVFMLNPETVSLKVSKTHFRAKGETSELQNRTGYRTSIYSALQFVTSNKSRVGVIKA